METEYINLGHILTWPSCYAPCFSMSDHPTGDPPVERENEVMRPLILNPVLMDSSGAPS